MLAPRTTARTLGLGFLLIAFALPGCVRNAATGKLQFNAMSRNQEIALGLESRPEILSAYGGEVTDPVVAEYVDEIGHKLVVHTEGDYKDLPWKFTVLNTEIINAFALPGGQVFVSRGLAEKLGSEAALAGVIGHEIGHVTAEHVDVRMGRQLILAGIAVGLSTAANQSDEKWAQSAAGLVLTGAGVYSLRFDRGQEIESDKLGMRYMYRAKYDPSALLDVMEALAHSSGGAPPEFLSTHPHPETRIAKINERLAINPNYRATVNNAEYGRFESRYQDRMLRRLSMLGDSAHADLAMLMPDLYCGVCAARRAGR